MSWGSLDISPPGEWWISSVVVGHVSWMHWKQIQSFNPLWRRMAMNETSWDPFVLVKIQHFFDSFHEINDEKREQFDSVFFAKFTNVFFFGGAAAHKKTWPNWSVGRWDIMLRTNGAWRRVMQGIPSCRASRRPTRPWQLGCLRRRSERRHRKDPRKEDLNVLWSS